MANSPAQFKKADQKTLVRHDNDINTLTTQRMYFIDYAYAFILEAEKV